MGKAGDMTAAKVKYAEGIDSVEALLEKPSDLEAPLKQRCDAVCLALRLNSAQACIKTSDWITASEHSDKALILDKDNAKALYRRAVASAQIGTESRLEQAR